jgi:hypothetical protein
MAKGRVGIIAVARGIDHNHSCNSNTPKNIKRKVALVHIVAVKLLWV